MTTIRTVDIPDDFAWIREVRDRMYEETKHMTHEEFNEYTRKGVEEFERNIQRVKEQRKGGDISDKK